MYLGGVDFVEGDEGEGLGYYVGCEIFFCESKRDEDIGQEQLGEEGEGFDMDG